MTTNKKAQNTAENLLELHIQHELQNFQTEQFVAILKNESENIFSWLRDIKLQNVVTADQIKQVIHQHVVEENVPDAIAEMAGEAANKLFNSKRHQKTQLNKIISREQFEDFIDKLLELKEQRDNGIDKVIDLPIYGDLISGILYKAIIRYIVDSNLISKNIPGVSSMLKMGRSVVNKTVPKLGGGIEDSVRSYITDSLDFILEESKSFLEESVTEEELKTSAMELWSIIESKPLSEFQEGMNISEFVALGYDFWLQFRKSGYFKHCYKTVVDYFFRKYGKSPLSELLDDLAITPERARVEIERFAPQVLETLNEGEFLEDLIRRHLEKFYLSPVALNAIKDH